MTTRIMVRERKRGTKSGNQQPTDSIITDEKLQIPHRQELVSLENRRLRD
jgi:hypothetical protein